MGPHVGLHEVVRPVRSVRVDPRVRRTRRALHDALIALVEAGNTVTMSAVAQRADLSRQVLHSHYDSIERLASETLMRRLVERTGQSVDASGEATVASMVDAIRRDGLAPFLQAIRDDQVVFLALREIAHGRTTMALAQVFADLAADHVSRPSSGRPDAAVFVAGGMTTLMDAWLRSARPATAAEQATRMQEFARAVFAADGQQDQAGPER